VQDREFGRQFRAERLHRAAPAPRDGSGRVKGGGPVSRLFMAHSINSLGETAPPKIAENLSFLGLSLPAS
jgi:hypothetical protein